MTPPNDEQRRDLAGTLSDVHPEIPLASAALAYADVVTARGVTLDRDGDTLRIRLPVAAGCRWLWTAAALIFGVVTLAILLALSLTLYTDGPASVVSSAPCTLIPTAVLVALTAYALAAARIAFAGHEIRLTPAALTIRTVDNIGHRRLFRPRAAVVDVRLHSEDRSLLIYANDYGLMYGILRGQDPRVIEWIAGTLSAELDLTRQQ